MPSSATRPRTLKILRGEPPRVAANGTTTQRFFAEGDLHEGTQWKYARLPPDDAVETNSDTETRFQESAAWSWPFWRLLPFCWWAAPPGP